MNKFHKHLLKPFAKTYSKAQKNKTIKSIGISLYKLSLSIFIYQLKQFQDIKSIYILSEFDSSFIPGKSDIDIIVIVKDMPTKEEDKFLQEYFNKIRILYNLLPFIQITFTLFETDFRIYQKIMNREIFPISKHPTQWKLLYGRETRIKTQDNETQKYGTYFRIFYEEALFNIYEHYIRREENLRRLNKFSDNINKRNWSTNKLEEKSISKKDPIAILFNMIKKIESIDYPKGGEIIINKQKNNPSKDLESYLSSINKQKIKSIFLSKIPNTDNSHYLYIILKSKLSYEQFKYQTENIIKNLNTISSFKKEINKKSNSRYKIGFPEIFPLIITEKMMSIPEILGANLNPDEIKNLQKNGIKLYGENLRLNYNKEYYTKVKQKSFLVWANMNLIISQYLEITNPKKSKFMNNFTKKFILNITNSKENLDAFSYIKLRDIIKNER